MVLHGKFVDGLQPSIFNQQYLGFSIQSLFPNKRVRIPSPDSGFYLELDFWIPDLNLAFEFQDPHHYVTAWYSYSSVASTQKRDDFKSKIAKEKGVSLVVVPCWWDGKLESLIASIHQIRPDILPDFDKKGAKPISKEIPENFFSLNEVPGVGELMLASLPENHTFDPENWWLSEKYDGLRACFHPLHKSLYSRFGRKFNIPDAFLWQFPSSFVDGEIWFGRESHLEAQKLYIKVEKNQENNTNTDEDTHALDYKPTNEHENTNNDESTTNYKTTNYNITNYNNTRDDKQPNINESIENTSDGENTTNYKTTNYNNTRDDSIENTSNYKTANYNNTREDKQTNINESIKWEFMKLVVMDFADKELKELPFENRFRLVISNLDVQLPALTVVTSLACKSKKALHTLLQVILDGGGEGVILRQPKSKYFNGRSDAMKKYKTHRDQEGMVVAVDSTDVTVKLPNGNIFVSRVTPGERRTEITSDRIPKVGDIVTFKYTKISPFGQPWQATIDRIRKDLLWEDVLRSFNSQETRKRSADDCIELHGVRKLANGYWVEDDGKNTRMFFDKLAKQKGADPLIPDTWYKITYKDVIHAKGVSLLKYYGGSLKQALQSVYPNIGLDVNKFFRVTHNYWVDIANRRKFLENLAHRKGFDPRNVVHWYGITPKSLLHEKGGPAIFAYYNGSIAAALRDVYPDLTIDESQFFGIDAENKWRNPANRRKFMDEYASSKGFDPLVAENWYNTKGDDIVEAQGGTLFSFYNKSVTKLIISVYPDIGLDESRFNKMRKGYWVDANVKRFFDDFAKEKGFDPLIAENWYSISGRHIKKLKGGWSVVGNQPIANALVRVYPDIGIDPSLFAKNTMSKHWYIQENRKAFLDNFAASRGCDPNKESFWSSVKLDDLILEKGGKSVLSYYNFSLKHALVDVYPEIQLEGSKFDRVDNNYWATISNQRKAFDKVAKKYGFDPLVAERWYTFPKSILLQEKGINGIKEHHKGSVHMALIANYPELNMQLDLFRYTANHWHNKDSQRILFTQFAKYRHFDPLVSSEWLPYLDTDPKELRPVTRLYGKSVLRALADLYPPKIERQ